MPLIHSKSKKAFEHNLKAELSAGKPKDQSLAISYSIKRKAPKKKAAGGSVQSGSPDMNMAEGGEINAKNERRPMPDNRYDDSKMISHNSGNKPAKNDNWLDNPTIKQAQSNNGRQVLPIKRPKMVPSDAFSTRLYDEEGKLQDSANPGPYGKQPPEHDNEEGPDRQGSDVRDMADEHATHSKPYIKEIEDQYAQDVAEADMKRSNSYARGGMIDKMNHPSKHDMQPADSGIQEEEREDEADLMSMESPSEDEGSSDARSMNEEGPDRQGDDVPDMEDEHSTGRKPYAGGGKISDFHEDMDEELNPAHDHFSSDDSEDQPEDEEREEHHNSIAAAIMAKKDKKALQMSDSDMDEMIRLYEGGEISERRGKILSHGSMDSDDSDQADLRRNAEEDANEEDQQSFHALEKENYSESEGLDDLDSPMDSAQHGDDEEEDSENKHDMISSIRRKMKSKRQF
jgi:hypothetical protein